VGPADDTAVCATALFCDDFEGFAPAAAPSGAWTVDQNNATVVVATDKFFRGAQAAKASTVASVAGAPTYKSAFLGLTGAPVVPVPNQRVYGRMMFFLDSAPTTNVHWSFVDVTGLVPGQTYPAAYRYGGQLPVDSGGTFVGSQFMANYDTTAFYATPSNGPRTDCYKHADMQVVPVGKWSCAEWLFDGQNNEMRFWLDGTEITGLHIEGTGAGCVGQDPSYTWVAPTFSRLDVGWQSYQADDARTIWIDDVVLSETMVGCPSPRP